MKFHRISLEDREWISQRLKEEQPEACEYTFVNNFVWRKAYRVEVAEYEGCGIIRYCDNGKCMYSYPFGNGDKKTVIEKMRQICAEEGRILSICPLTDRHRSQLKEWFPGEFLIIPDRDDFDYVYSRDKLAELKGKKYHGKRNHIARFKDEGDWSYEHITEANLEECRIMHREWITFREDKWNTGVAEETEALHEAFDHYKEFGLVGGLVRKAGHIVAFAIGEPLNDKIMVVHFEKAYPDMQGAYPMINQQFVINECADYEYINREEDTGDAGLRKAKLSYYPEILLKKYYAIKSHVTFADKNDFESIKVLWNECFGDDDEYIDFYLKKRFNEENMLVIREDGKVVSMASFLPATLKCGEEYMPVRYVYAVATLPEYRKRGYAAEIIKTASDAFKEPLVLQPENESLKKYYKGLGFGEYFRVETWKIENVTENMAECLKNSAKEMDKDIDKYAGGNEGKNAETGVVNIYEDKVEAAEIKEINGSEYKKLRDEYFDKEGYLCWDEEAVEYAVLENELCGGKTVRIDYINNEQKSELFGIAMIRRENDELHIIESTISKEQIIMIMPELNTLFEGVKNVVYDNKGGMILYNDKFEFKTGTDAYMNLTLG
jgi:hypothetical protein